MKTYVTFQHILNHISQINIVGEYHNECHTLDNSYFWISLFVEISDISRNQNGLTLDVTVTRNLTFITEKLCTHFAQNEQLPFDAAIDIRPDRGVDVIETNLTLRI